MKKIILGLFVFVSVFLVTGCGGIKEKDLINTTWEYHSDTQDYKYEFKKGGKVVYSYHSDDNIYSSD